MIECTKVQNRFKTNLAIIGLGFVGLPLAILFAKKGFRVTGIDIDTNKIKNLNKGLSYLPDVKNEEIEVLMSSGNFSATTDYNFIENQDAILICVPTPLTPHNSPDLSFVQEAGNQIALRIKKGQLVILESSTYPGTTTEVLQPILEKSKLKVGVDIFLSYSPERVDPGNKKFEINQIPKVVSGVTTKCEKYAYNLYKEVYETVVPVNSTDIAELTKLLENSYRFVNISFINEFAMLCDKLNVNIWDVIEAAGSKPYGFQTFLPGPGIGGHCIPVDPLYLYWKAQQYDFDFQFLRLSTQINQLTSEYIVKQIRELISSNLPMEKANILIYGVAYKKDISDSRESPAIPIINLLLKSKANVYYHDPLVGEIMVDEKKLTSTPLSEELLNTSDCVVVITDHSEIPIQNILDNSKLVYDTRNITKGFFGKSKVFRLGGGEERNEL